MTRRFLVFLGQLPLILAAIGILMFAGGLGAQYVIGRAGALGDASRFTGWAWGGLALAATMFLAWFVIVGLLLGVQARRYGSGYGKAYRLMEAFKFEDAIPLLERSIAEGKGTVDVLMLLASAYAHTGRLAQAQEIADRAVELYPQQADAYLTLSNVYRMQAAYDAAADVLVRAVRLEAQSPALWAELGLMHLYAGNGSAAREALERATQESMPAMYAVRVYYHLSNFHAEDGDAHRAARAAAKMVSAREGLASWQSGLAALAGTSYGQRLARELEEIEQALREADAGHTG